MAEFSHLHLHTQYSLLDGAIRVDELFPKCLELGMKSVAMTDHGNLFGAVDFYEKALKHGVKPIFGCETYVAPDRLDKTERRSHHLILLARDNAGWRNLSYLNSMGFLEGFYYSPRIDKQLLREHSQGLIGSSACLGGEIAQTLTRRGVEAAEQVAREYQDIFGRGNFFLEMMANGLPEQIEVNYKMIELSKKTGIPTIATNDCHYLNRKDSRAHEILMCVQQKRTVKDDKRLQHPTDAYYLRSPAEMNELFKDWPQALENAARVGELCQVSFDLGKSTHFPRFQVPDGFTADSYVAELARRGLLARFEVFTRLHIRFDPDLYQRRLEHELGVIQGMGFSGYFLIVQDFINYAKAHRIPVGPGRGSGAGSLTAYSLRITDIDPIANKLLFERFLNPERVSLPDFDVDFCMNRRDEVIRYVTDKYGKDNVGQIVTMHQLKARSCIRDVARAMGMAVADANRVATMVPEPIQGKSPPLSEAIEQEPRLKQLYQGGGEYRELLETAMRLEGLNRHAGMHAAGVVIAERPLWEYVPLFKPAGEEQIVTQFNMTDVEKAGLVKFDFLGLKTLTVIQTGLDLINKERLDRGEPPFELETVPLDDAEVYQMLSGGDVTGVFQVESSGFRELLKKLKPDCFEDIVAAGALYRPGPLEGGMVDDFIDRKHGRKKVEYDDPLLEPILKDTYGIIVYQEQVMQISSALAGYSLGRADLLRRAMGKKKASEMAKEKAGFLAGARERNIDLAVAERVFDLMEKFAGYGFNRSHSAAYGLLTFQTAYLKRHFPVEFNAALLTCDRADTDAIVKFIAEARSQGIPVLRPDINESDANFTVVRALAPASPGQETAVPGRSRGGRGAARASARSAEGKGIRFGLAAVKGVGAGAVEAIQAVRASGGPFLSFTDFCLRVDGRKVNRKVLEALVKSGAFDGIAEKQGKTRATLYGHIGPAMDRAAQVQRERESGQISLLALLDGTGGARGASADAIDDSYSGPTEEWLPRELLAYEKESLGFYISGHPLDRYAGELRRFATASTATAMERGPGAEVILGGVVCDYQERMAKSGSGKYAFFKLEDQLGQVEFMVGGQRLLEFRDSLTSGEPLLVTGTIDAPFGEGEMVRERIRFQSARALAKVRSERSSMMEIRLDADRLTEEALGTLERLLRQFPGTCRTWLHLEIPRRSDTILELPHEYDVSASEELLAKVEQLFGDRVAVLR
jgi:DNA polymerase III subunit alpha